jgi:hypothetical protein
MESSNNNANLSLIKNDKGLFVQPDFLMKNEETLKKAGDAAIKTYNKKRQEALDAPTPEIQVPFSCVLTKAAGPKMVNALASLGLHKDQYEVDERFLAQMKIMNDNVSDEQEIVLVGTLVDEIFKPGKMAKISFARYRTVRDTNDGVIQTAYDVPTYTINGSKYIMLDQRDILWVFDKKEEKDEII